MFLLFTFHDPQSIARLPRRRCWAVAIALLLLIPSLSACTHDPASLGLPFRQGDVIYPQANFRAEWRGRIWLTRSTNHIALPRLIPLNSKITVQDLGSDWLKATVPGDPYTWNVEFIAKHNKMSFAQWLGRNFAKQPLTLPSQLTAREKQLIKEGKYEMGMSRSALLLSLGQPPASLTPNAKTDKVLVYEQKRFNRIAFTFGNDDRLAEVKD